MFKTFISTISLLLLLIFNTAIFTWCVNQLEWGKTDSKRVLITSVQAKSDFKPISKPITQRPIRPSKYVTPFTNNVHAIGRLYLRFHSTSTRLESEEQTKLENILKELDIGSSHSVLIFSGTTKSVNNDIPAIPRSPQISKLRVQTIARVIYPYTQTVKMSHHSSIEGETVVIEFFESSN
ncbi:hypothetical protein QUF50_04715 [Thiotrichales bacterium HSG1]|nr:hypothetical protein [Thiotrichales bacterium HSG1]